MIQRIQSIYLLLAVAMLGLEYTFDSVWKGPSAEAYSWFVPVTTGVFTLAAIGALGAIFLYSQRKRQRSLVVVSQVIALLGLLILFGTQFMTNSLPAVAASAVAFEAWAALACPVLAYLMLMMARRAIDKDIALVRSMDRLR
jgi:peptidoglycan/LPS O-acetylase OafA/YrhL